MKLVAAAAGLLLVAGGAGGYVFLNCPTRCQDAPAGDVVLNEGPMSPCCMGEEKATAPVAATPVAATPVAATPVAATPAAMPAEAAAKGGCCGEETPAVAKTGDCCDVGGDCDEAPAKIEK